MQAVGLFTAAEVTAAGNNAGGRTKNLRKARALRKKAEVHHRCNPGLANYAVEAAKAIQHELGNTSKWEKLEEVEIFLASAAIKHSLNFRLCSALMIR